MRRREGCGRESEDAAVAHLCLPRAPPISAPAPVTDAKGGNRAGKIWCARGAGSPQTSSGRGGAAWGAHREAAPPRQAGGAQVRAGGDPRAPVTCHSTRGGCRLSWHHVAAAASRSAGSEQYLGFSVPRSTARRRGCTGSARQGPRGPRRLPGSLALPKQPSDPVPPHAAGPHAAPGQPPPRPLHPSAGPALPEPTPKLFPSPSASSATPQQGVPPNSPAPSPQV